jgi:hypothetical protein
MSRRLLVKQPCVALDGAHERNRTFDLLLTKEVLYRLSYVSVKLGVATRSPGFAAMGAAKSGFNGAGDGIRTRIISLEG